MRNKRSSSWGNSTRKWLAIWSRPMRILSWCTIDDLRRSCHLHWEIFTETCDNRDLPLRRSGIYILPFRLRMLRLPWLCSEMGTPFILKKPGASLETLLRFSGVLLFISCLFYLLKSRWFLHVLLTSQDATSQPSLNSSILFFLIPISNIISSPLNRLPFISILHLKNTSSNIVASRLLCCYSIAMTRPLS